MKRIIFGGSGFIGQALAKDWLSKNIPVCVVGRNKNKLQELFPSPVEILTWNEFDQAYAFHLKQSELIINLCGENIGEKRWTYSRQKQILDSRINITRKLAHYCARLSDHCPRLFNASAIGIYGLAKDPKTSKAFDESFDPTLNPNTDFLSQVAISWEKALQPAIDAHVQVIKLRFGVVLAKHGGALKQMLPAYYFGLGGVIGTGDQVLSWIALDDLIRAINFLIEHKDLSGAFNLVAPHPVTQKQFARTLCDILHRPCLFKMPTWLIKLIFGQMGEELLLQGQRVLPYRLIEKGFQFNYPDIKSALKHILK